MKRKQTTKTFDYTAANLLIKTMDFIDFTTYQSEESGADTPTRLPEPAPPLVLPLNQNLTSKLQGLSLLKKKLDFSTSQDDKGESNTTTQTAEKYAKISESIFNDTHDDLSINGRGGAAAYATSSSTKGNTDAVLSKKLAGVLNSYGLNEGKMRESLEILQQKQELELKLLVQSDVFGAMQRRRFRSDIEGELLKQHSSVLREFQPVVTRVEQLGERINELKETKSKLTEFDHLDPELLSKIDQLTKQKNLIMLKKSILLSFKNNFTLTQYEEHVLTNEDISLVYFEVLQKCNKINNNCSILLTLQNQTLGLKIMEKMSRILDLAYQRIAFFLTNRLDQFMGETSRESSTSGNEDIRLMKIALFYLNNNLKYFDEVTGKLIESRSKAIVDEFIYQSSNSDPSDNARPIVLSAHDPVRYIGDLLAFVHSVIVNEVEFVSTLFKIGEDTDSNFERTEFERNLIQLENSQDVNRSIDSTIDQIVGALSRPLKSRLEQIIRSDKNFDVITKLFNLLDLYRMMFQKQLTKDSSCSIFETLESVKLLCVERVLSILKEKVLINEKQLEGDSWRIDDDSLLTPDWIRDFYNSSLLIFDEVGNSEGHPLNMDDETYKGFLNLLIDKPIELIQKQAKANFKNDKVNWKILVINSLDYVESKILTIPALSTEFDKISHLVGTVKEELIQHQYETLLKDSGLDIHQQLIQLIFPIEQIETDEDYYMYSSLIENKLFNKDKLQEIETKLHEFLPNALIDIQQALFKISSPSIANDIITESSLKFLKLYNVYYKILHILYEDEEILEWSTYDVATLLGVEKAYEELEQK